MLEFIRESVSGNLAAHSKVTPFKVYFIDDDSAWKYLTVTGASKRGPCVRNVSQFITLEEAKTAAENMEGVNHEY